MNLNLSLHVDWQRQLFSILQNQRTSNQFIVATHSPFIYSKYPDKEILLSTDRGDDARAVLMPRSHKAAVTANEIIAFLSPLVPPDHSCGGR